MAYTLVYSGGNITVVDGTLNTTNTSLALPGRNYSGYGSPVDQNFVSALENFASANSSGPVNTIKGQLWFDSSTSSMKFNTSNTPGTPSWSTVAVNSSNSNVAFNNLTLSGYLMHSVNSTVSAAGSSQSDATALTKTINVITIASSGQGVRLPTSLIGMVLYVTNTSGNTVTVYPASGARINGLSTNAGLTMGSNATIHLIAPTTTQWYTTGATYA